MSLEDNVRSANGLMSLAVYEAIYEAGRARGPLSALEIGTAHGASAIAFAMGARAARPDFTMTTVDPMQGNLQRGEPSSRSKFGSPEENRRIVESNFARAGLGETITLFVGTSLQFAASRSEPARIDAILIDADGRFDRDLILFRDRIAEGALVVLDDVAGPPKISPAENDTRWIDLKHTISARLLDAYVAEGLLVEDRRVGITAFCTAVNVDHWTLERLSGIALECYRDLVFTQIDSAMVIKWAMAEPGHFDEALLGRRVMRSFGGPIRAARAMKNKLTRAKDEGRPE